MLMHVNVAEDMCRAYVSLNTFVSLAIVECSCAITAQHTCHTGLSYS